MPHILTEILILAGVATAITTASHFLKLPTMVGFVLTGLIVGPKGAGLVSSLPDAYSLTEWVSVILMFTIGLEFSFAKLRQLRSQLLKLGSLQVFVTMLLTWFIAWAVSPLPAAKIVLWGFLITLSSTALVLKLLNDYRDSNAPHGRNSIGILIFQDIMVIPMLLILPFLVAGAGGPSGLSLDWQNALYWFGEIFAILGFMIFVHKFLLVRLMSLVLATRSHELFFFSILFVCLGTGYLFHLVGLSLSIGAFVAGAIISESSFGHQARSIFESLRDTFLGLFFATIGMLLDLKFIADHLLLVGGLALAVLGGKFLVIFLICRINRFPWTVSAFTALALTQIGEFSFLIVSQGVELGIMSQWDNQVFLTISILSLMLTPFLYLLGPRLMAMQNTQPFKALEELPGAQKLAQDFDGETKMGGRGATPPSGDKERPTKQQQTLVIGFGIAGSDIVNAFQSLSLPYQVLDSHYELVKQARLRGVHIAFGDAGHSHVLAEAGIERAKMVVIAISDTRSVPRIISAVRRVRPDVPIVVRLQYLRDVEALQLDPKITLVIAEIETATEILAEVLKGYGVDSQRIYDFTLEARHQLITNAKLAQGQRYRVLNLPNWDILTAIHPIHLEKGDHAVGKRLDEIALPFHTGASIVAVFREGLGTNLPKKDFVLHSHDVVHVITPEKDLAEVEGFLRKGLTA